MKKFLTSLLIISCCFLTAPAQKASNVLAYLSDNDNIGKISVNSVGMFFAKMFGGMQDMPSLKGLKSIDVYMVNDETTKPEKEKIRKQLIEIKDDKEYSTLVKIKENKDNIHVLMKKEKDMVKSILMIILSQKDDAVVLNMKGKFKESDIKELVTQMKE